MSPQQSWNQMQAGNGQPTQSPQPPSPGGLLQAGQARDMSAQVNAMAGSQEDIDPKSMAKLARIKESSYLVDSLNEPKGDNLQGLDPNTMGGGFIEGYTAAKNIKNQQFQQKMAGEQQAWKRTDRDEKRQVDFGMKDAAQAGGYEGVIEYLKGADPDRALAFHQQKLELDKSIMQNDMYAFMMPLEKDKAMIEAYGTLGKMGMAILNAPAKDRQNMYDTMKPMIHTINPNAPANVEAAAGMFLLGAAQATPQNQLFRNTQGVIQADSQIGKLSNDRMRMLASGVPTDSPQVQAIDNQLVKYRTQGQQSQLQLYRTQLNMNMASSTEAQKVMQATESTNTNMQSGAKDFNAFMNIYRNISPAMQKLKENPDDVYSQQLLARNFAMMLNKGALSEADAAVPFTAYGVADWKKKAKSWASGEVNVLNPNEAAGLTKAYEAIAQSQIKAQEGKEAQFKKSSTEYKLNNGTSIVNWNAVRLPSQQYYDLQENPSQQPQTPKQGAPAGAIQDVLANPKLLPDFVKYYGYDPTKPAQGQGGK